MSCPIRTWFEQHEGNEFFVAPRALPFSVIPPTAQSDTFLYCTKPHIVSQIADRLEDDLPIASVARGGLPSEDDVAWLAALVGSHRLLFLGDADPPDLLIFAWLRERIDIAYLGTSDHLLSRFDVALEDHLTIPLDETESATAPLFAQYLPDMSQLLGQNLTALLKSGRKLELEALAGLQRVYRKRCGMH